VMNADRFDLAWSRRKGCRSEASVAQPQSIIGEPDRGCATPYASGWRTRTLVEAVDKKSGRRFETTW